MDQLTLSVISLIISVVSGPVLFLAIGSVHKVKTEAIIKEAFKEERERSKDIYALKSEVSEMKVHVGQLVINSRSVDEKLDKIQDSILTVLKRN